MGKVFYFKTEMEVYEAFIEGCRQNQGLPLPSYPRLTNLPVTMTMKEHWAVLPALSRAEYPIVVAPSENRLPGAGPDLVVLKNHHQFF